MEIAFQIALILIMVLSGILTFGYPDDKESTTRAIAMFFATLLALMVTIYL